MAWPRFITHNLGWKLASLGFATLVWFTIHYGVQDRFRPGTTRAFSNVPITVMTTANETRNFRVRPDSVQLVVRGEGTFLRDLRPGDITAFADLTGVTEAKALRKRIQVHTPPGVVLVWVAPTEVSVESQPVAPPGKR
jgi:hypothetical protein